MIKKTFLSLLFSALIFTLVACSKDYKDYMDDFDGFTPTIGEKRNNESLNDLSLIYSDETAKDIKVLPVDLEDDFIVGVDLSSIIAVEEAGAVFYNANGEEQDFLYTSN